VALAATLHDSSGALRQDVERLLPRLQSARVVTSGYLDRDRPAAEGWAVVDRRTADGWAADLLTLST